MKPIRTQVLFKPLPPEEISAGGIFVPESARTTNNRGILVDVGPGLPLKPMKFNKGECVIRVQGWGEEVIIDEESYFLMDMDSILAIDKSLNK